MEWFDAVAEHVGAEGTQEVAVLPVASEFFFGGADETDQTRVRALPFDSDRFFSARLAERADADRSDGASSRAPPRLLRAAPGK